VIESNHRILIAFYGFLQRKKWWNVGKRWEG